MGQGQSQPQRARTPEQALSHEEQARTQADMRAKQQAALDKRLRAQGKKPSTAGANGVHTHKKQSALEQMSKENLAWRNADTQTNLRRWD